MRIDNKQLQAIYSTLAVPKKRNVLRELADAEPLKFSEMKQYLDKDGAHANVTAYHIRKLMNANLVMKEKKTGYYILTRFGIQVLNLMTQFENICMTYDISDCDSNGQIKMVIKRNLGRKKIEV